jgi:antitoxin component YwqK of YwqJK toxin-antitoxin module
MKKSFSQFFALFALILLVSACSETPKPKKKGDQLIEIKNGVYTEYYPGRKAVKFQGPQNKDGDRNGRWFYFDEKGNEMSMTEYTDGKMNGFIFVRYPNGAMRYTGEYSMGKETGIWRFYNEKGEIEIEKNYGKAE